MKGATVVRLAALAVGLAIAAFAVLGTTRLVVGVDTARVLAAPLFASGLALATVLFCLAVLDRIGVLTIEPE